MPQPTLSAVINNLKKFQKNNNKQKFFKNPVPEIMRQLVELEKCPNDNLAAKVSSLRTDINQQINQQSNKKLQEALSQAASALSAMYPEKSKKEEHSSLRSDLTVRTKASAANLAKFGLGLGINMCLTGFTKFVDTKKTIPLNYVQLFLVVASVAMLVPSFKNRDKDTSLFLLGILLESALQLLNRNEDNYAEPSHLNRHKL